MGFVQQNTGSATNGTSFTASLPSASSASNCVVVIVSGSTTVTTPTNWTLRTSQVNFMGHYWFERSGVSVTSQAFVGATASPETWWMFEIAGGVYDIANSANNSASGTTYNTPTITPAAGNKLVVADLGSQDTAATRTMSGWTNSFVEQVDFCATVTDFPLNAGAALVDVAANGATGYSTTATYSVTNEGRSALIGAYATTTAAAVPAGDLTMMMLRR